MSPPILVFFDFACPWSYAARAREGRLARELGVRFEYMRSGLDTAPFVAAANAAAWTPHLQGVDALGEKLGVATTVTYLLPPGDAANAYQGLGSYDELRTRLASRVNDGDVTA